MIVFTVIGVTGLLAAIAVWQMRANPASSKKERGVFLFMMGIGWIIFMILMLFPGVPGPTQWIEAVFGSFGKWIQ